MNSGKLDVFTDGVGNDFTILCHGIHFYFFGMFDELAHYYRMLLGYVGSQLQEAFQFFLVGAYVHGSTGKYV